MNKKNKTLLGIELFRGIAAYGVILIHGLGTIPRTQNALLITNFFSAFCVPFFLIASFYFTRKAILSTNTNSYILHRSKRIIIPYLSWTIIYLCVRFLGSFLGNRDSFDRLISDPLNIFFFGAAGVQLYFMPMLFSGSLAAIPINKFFQKYQNYLLLYVLFGVSIYAYFLVRITGNDFILGEGIAFQKLIDLLKITNIWFLDFLRLIFVFFAWTIRCIPYIIFCIIIQDSPLKKLLNKFVVIGGRKNNKWIILIFIPLMLVWSFLLHIDVIIFLIPYILFVYAIFISSLIVDNSVVGSLAIKLN